MAKKRETTSQGYRQFKKDLSQGQLGSLYIFHGEETYLRDHYLDQVKKALIPEGMEAFNYHPLSGKGLTVQRLGEVVDALPMMSEHTLLVVNDYDLFKAPERERTLMAQLIEELPEYCCLVFLYDTIPYKSDARMKKLAGALKARGQVVEFARQDQRDLMDWVRRRFRALNRDIDPQDAQYLIFLCGDLMNGLIGEIEKIGAYSKGPRISRQDIDTVAIPVIDAVVFQMTDALTQGQHAKALSILHDLFRLQHAPIMLLAVLGKQMRQLYASRVVLEAGQGTSALMELWGMRSAYPAEKLMRAARHYELPWCRWAMARCAQVDLAMKSVSGADSQDLMLSLLLELSAGGAPC